MKRKLLMNLHITALLLAIFGQAFSDPNYTLPQISVTNASDNPFSVSSQAPISTKGTPIKNLTTEGELPMTKSTIAPITPKETTPTTMPTTTTTMQAPKACVGDWRKYGGDCYKMFYMAMNWDRARRFCQFRKSDLVTVGDLGELNWLVSFVSEVPRESLWIGLKYAQNSFKWVDNSSLSISYWSPGLLQSNNWQREPCVFVKSAYTDHPGYWYYSSCSIPRGFICKMAAQEADIFHTKSVFGCSNGMFAWRSSCYWFVEEPLSALQGTTKCMKDKGHAFDIEDRRELYFIKSLLYRRPGEKFWSGLNQLRAKGIFQWSHGQALSLDTRQLGLNLPTGYKVSAVGRCSYITVENGIQKMRLTQCSEKHKVLCERLRNGYTTPGPWQGLTATAMPEKCPYLNFKDYNNGKCIMIYSAGTKTWRQAEEYCWKYGAHLLTYNTYKANPYIYSRDSKDYWIGLQITPSVDRKPNSETKWSDGTVTTDDTLEYPHAKKASLCAYRRTLSTRSKEFHFDSCSTFKKFICEVNKRAYTLPSPKIRDEKMLPCPNGDKNWWGFNGYCYYHSFNSEKHIDKKKIWQAANDSCIKKEANLVSIHTDDEAEFLIKLVRNRTGLSFDEKRYPWIGLRNNILTNTYFWSDHTLLNMKMWNVGTFNTYYMNRCAVLNNNDGQWNIDKCYVHRYYICKKFTRGPVTTPKTPEKVFKDCTLGWHAYGNKCFKYFSHRASWHSAENTCKKYNGHLVSIRNQHEQDYLLLVSQQKKFWTGLSDKKNENGYVWADGSKLAYTNWASGEPNDDLNSIKEDCIESGEARSKGQWNDVSCSYSRPYLCQYYRNLTMAATSVLPTSEAFKCPKYAQQNGTRCYYIGNKVLTYFDAVMKCFYLGGHLERSNSVIFATGKIQQKNSSSSSRHGYWAGRFHVKDRHFLPLDWNKLLQGVTAAGENCAILRGKNVVESVNCSQKNSYVCRITKEAPSAQRSQSGSKCLKTEMQGWFDFGGAKCYRVMERIFQWTEAKKVCKFYGSRLLTIDSMKELKMVSSLVAKFESVWIGMSRNITTGSSEWVERSSTNFSNWNEDKPNKDQGTNCVEMDSATLKWKYTFCYYKRNIICEMDKISSSKESIQEKQQQAQENNTSKPRELNYGYIVGLVILGICALAFIVFGLSMYIKRRQYTDISTRGTRGSESESLTSH